MAKTLKITLTKSPITYAKNQRETLKAFKDGDVVDFQALQQKGLVKKELKGVKVLGNGELAVKLTVKAKKFTKTAEEKIKAAGGTIEVL